MRILFFGDSITQGFRSLDGGWVDKIRRHYDGLALQNHEPGQQPEIFNLGISGDTTRNLLTRIELETRVRKWRQDPVIIVVAIGTNDDVFEGGRQWVNPDEFKANLEKIIGILEPLADDVVLVGNPACDESKTMPVSWGDFTYANRELQRSEQTIAAVAETYGLAYVPLFANFKDRLAVGEDLLEDGLHPNDAGHQYIAEQVLPVLESAIEQLRQSPDSGRK